MKASAKVSLLLLLIAVAWFLWPEAQQSEMPASIADSPASETAHSASRQLRLTRVAHDEGATEELPKGKFEYLFDKATHAKRFLFAKGRDDKFLPHSDAPSGMDLWLQDESGEDRLIHKSVTRAKFSPDGGRVAFTTSDAVLHVEDLSGTAVAEVAGVYGPSWKPDGSSVIFSKVGEGQDPHRPGTRQLSALNVATGEIQPLTDGRFDDGLPEFNPSSDWVIFVSGARTGLASFWKVPADGGTPVQLTNLGLQEVNERFVPTPYDRTLWSGDQRWFVYDFKSGEQQETWGLEFNPDGSLRQAAKLANGINPRWQDDGMTLVCEKTTETGIETVVATLP